MLDKIIQFFSTLLAKTKTVNVPVAQSVSAPETVVSTPVPTASIPVPDVVIKSFDGCYPPFKEKALAFITACWARGWYIYPNQIIRTFAEQDVLYAKGRSGVPGEKIVTKAKGGESFHNFCLAFDVDFDTNPTKAGNQASWDLKYPWKELGAFGESFGLTWGGNFNSLEGADLGHFHMAFGFSIEQLLAFYQVGGMGRVWQELNKVNNK